MTFMVENNVAASQPAQRTASTFTPQMALSALNILKIPMRDGKTRTLELGNRPEQSTQSSASTSQGDKTDNHDFSFDDTPQSPDMRREDERLKTFEKWPVSFMRPQDLAKSGFYYLGRGDEVRCAFCKVEIMRWEEGDDPAVDHQRWAPQCPLLRNAAPGNVPIATTEVGRDECGARIRPPGPANSLYASESARLRSFKDWPRSMRQRPEDLAEAGFYYTGQGDKTKCFYCDGGLKDWEDDDVPWEQHARWFDRCAYVQLVKGREYVEKVMSEHQAQVKAEQDKQKAPELSQGSEVQQQATTSPSDDKKDLNNTDDSKLCKICFAEERNVCFIPCGHVVACAKCALAADKCPMCRRTLQGVVRLYYS